jgi:hypothetical protein
MMKGGTIQRKCQSGCAVICHCIFVPVQAIPDPVKPPLQLHANELPITEQSALASQGLVEQGSMD